MSWQATKEVPAGLIQQIWNVYQDLCRSITSDLD